MMQRDYDRMVPKTDDPVRLAGTARYRSILCAAVQLLHLRGYARSISVKSKMTALRRIARDKRPP